MMDFSKNDLSNAQKGDQLWDLWFQKWVEVKNIDLINVLCPEVCNIELSNGDYCTLGGITHKDQVCPRYFWNKIHFDIPERPKRKVKKEIKVWTAIIDGEAAGTTSCEAVANKWREYGDRVEELIKVIEIEE